MHMPPCTDRGRSSSAKGKPPLAGLCQPMVGRVPPTLRLYGTRTTSSRRRRKPHS